MKIVLHWMAKDARRLWPWLVVWGLAVASPLVFGIRFLQTEPTTVEVRQAGDLLGWLGLAQAVIGYVVTLLLIQEDRAIDARAFWPTRPIGPGRLMLAKLGFVLAAGVVLPCLLRLPWWLGCGIGWSGALDAALEWMMFVPVVVVPAAFVAALTDSLGRAILWSFIVLAFSMITPMFGLAFQGVMSPRAIGAGLLAVVGALTVMLTPMAAVVAIAYRQRRYSATFGGPVAAAVVGMMIVWLAAGFYRPDTEPSPWQPERAADVALTFQAVGTSPAGGQRGQAVPQSQVWTSYELGGMPSDMTVTGLLAIHQWRWPGAEVERTGTLAVLGLSRILPGFAGPKPDGETTAWRAEQRARYLAEAARKGRPTTGFGSRLRAGGNVQSSALLPASFAARMERESPAYRARLWLAFDRPAIANDLRLEPDGWQRGDLHGARLDRLEDRGVDVILRVVDAERSLPWWRELNRVGAGASRGGAVGRLDGYQLIQRERREAAWLHQGKVDALTVAGVKLSRRVLVTEQLAQRRGEDWQTRPGWLDTARLVYVRYARESVFRREVTHPALPLANGERNE